MNNTNYVDCSIVKYTGTVYPFYKFGVIINGQLNPVLVEDYIKTQYGQYKGGAVVLGQIILKNGTSTKSLSLNATCQFASFQSYFSVYLHNTASANNNVAITVTPTKLQLYDYGYNNPQTTEYEHGLTIANNLTVKIKTDNTGKWAITIGSMGVEYNAPDFYPTISSLNYIEASSDASSSNTSFTAFLIGIDKPIWLFGDSYIGYSNARWLYYLLTRDKPTQLMIDGYGGENSTNALKSLKTAIEMGTPKYVVWCLGMNDGTDGANPSSTWLNAINELKTICDSKGIKLVLATIPSVPDINHEKKNEWVRNSGYQYIDFAKAVGASSSGVWYTGMLSNDNVHPTDLGALTLYYQAITDCPQLLEN